MGSKIGIVGNGFVGNAIAKGFAEKFDVLVYDRDPERSKNTYKETIACDFVFVCLPTPMVSAEGGECNLSIIEKFFDGLPEANGIFIIKSTVPAGTTDRLRGIRSDLKIVHSPEFLTAVNSEEDFMNSDRHVIGGDKDSVDRVKEIYKTQFPDTPVIGMKSKESECVKYFANCFLTTKLMFFNEARKLCDSLGDVNYDKIIEGVISDSRIGKSHYSVPGPDGEFGFGGTCFPKDTNALIKTMEKNGIDPLVLKAVWEQNKNYRKNWDWTDNKSAVLKKD